MSGFLFAWDVGLTIFVLLRAGVFLADVEKRVRKLEGGSR